MMNDNKWKVIFVIFIAWLGIVGSHSSYPSIIWHPMNPLFACPVPKINVRILDTVRFVFPSDEYDFFMNSTNSKLLYENLYFLKTNLDQYEACNATGMQRLRNCEGTEKLDDCDIKNLLPSYTVTFLESEISPEDFTFVKGETYYFIGTGFRTAENLKNLIGGSCNHVDNFGIYKLRLQIYVCKDDDVDCHICESEGCYYKECSMECPKSWTQMSYLDTSNQCKVLHIRYCTNRILGQTFPQINFTDILCGSIETGNGTKPRADKLQGSNPSSDGLVTGLAIIVVISFVVGIFIGVLGFKMVNERQWLQKRKVNAMNFSNES